MSERPRLDLVTWFLRLALALLFLYAGADKFPSGPHAMWVRLFVRIGLGQWFRYFTGVVEVGGALLLLIPRATFIAVPLLASAMVGALLVHVFVMGVGVQTIAPTVLLVGVLAIGWRQRARSHRAEGRNESAPSRNDESGYASVAPRAASSARSTDR